MIRYRFGIADEAEQDLREIIEYITVSDPVEQAQSLLDRFLDVCDSFSTQPLRERYVPELRDIGIRSFREILRKPYRIICEIVGRRVDILVIADGRRTLSTLLQKRLLRLGQCHSTLTLFCATVETAHASTLQTKKEDWSCTMSRFALVLLLANFTSTAAAMDTDHFVFHLYDGLDNASISNIVIGLEGNYERLTTKYRPQGMPKINVHLFDDIETLKQEGPMAEPQGIGFVTVDGEDAHIWLWVLDETEIDMMLDRFRRERVFAATDGRRVLDPVNSAIHEFVHLVTVYVDDRIGNNPRWLWESIALYELGHVFDPKVNAGSLENIRRPFADLEQDARLYLIGGAITDFIVRRWGEPAVRQLIETQGDTESVLGLPQAAFEQAFWKYLNEHSASQLDSDVETAIRN